VDRGVVLAHLEVAERYVDTGGRYIDRLRETIDARARGGSDTTATQDLLRHIEAAQEKFVSYRDWLLKELKNSTW
jgi:hypothetical protein